MEQLFEFESRISLFSEAVDDEESVISFGDIIWLQHIERDNYLIYDNKKDITQLLNKGFYSQCKTFVNLLYQGVLPSGYKPFEYGLYFLQTQARKGRNSNGMWKIESVDKFHADKFGWGSHFRLRHIGYALYFC